MPSRLNTAELVLRRSLHVGLLGLPVFALLGAFWMALGYDEAWFLLHVRELIESGRYGGGGEVPYWTTGGVQVAGSALLSLIGGGTLWVVRLLSVAALALLLLLCFDIGRRCFGTSTAGLLVAAPLAAVPGTLVFSSTAYAPVTATVLVMAGAWLWSREERSSLGPLIAAGICFGAAAATRWNCILVLPALVAAAFTPGTERTRAMREAIIAAGVGALVFAASIAALAAVSEGESAALEGHLYDSGVVAALHRSGVELLARWELAQRLFPFLLLALGTVFWIWLRTQLAPRWLGLDLLPWFAWLNWLAWLLREGEPHLRYLWPSLAVFALLLGFLLAWLHAEAQRREMHMLGIAMLAVAMACIVTGYAWGVRAVTLGDGDALAWEWSGTGLVQANYQPFERARDQTRMVELLESQLAQDESAVVLGLSLPLEYLSRRTLRQPSWFARVGLWKNRSALPRNLIVTPALANFFHLEPMLRPWIAANCVLVGQHGGYRLYRVTGQYPKDARGLP